ncbi:PAS domain S-box-containing protein/diguanylate cyclase (GGDEF) domain-containing protein [Lentzea xinjiangensis]|uniref:PAS domain S-box-containing protein/diguanylate cyclase (GGDEF) domain-containing protein n=1 Tax=Lentzea xinjiangensis TaxID=402600 RepID=A0A1H9MPY1_9PSEU|nr:EAL domain-containing protein [Lentzea xinjiangensis]SER25579.1 PAS domain S-box-containing protein/diguanylate cyclase (GGDEF) domain-containing protein [Lentzea xinjiangensis]
MNTVDNREQAVRWAAAISGTHLAGFARGKLELLLAGYVEQLLGGGVDAARQVGRSMVRNDFISPATLEQTLAVLGEHTPPAQLGALAAGYAEGLRERTLDRREVTRTAAITAMRRAESAVRASEAKFRAVFESSAFGIIVSGLTGELVDVNEALLVMLGYTRADLPALSGRDLVHPDDRPGLRELAKRLIASGSGDVRVEKRMIRSDGETIQTHMAMSLVRGEEGSSPYFVTMVENMNEMRALQTQLVRQSLNDMQTGLPNRAQFLGWLEGAAGSKGPDALALVQVDIDGFRGVNDAFGHDAGNRVLMHVATHLRAVFTEDVGRVARIGEDEFGVLIKDPRDVRSVVALVEDFTARLEEPIWIAGNGVGVTTSAGIVVRAARGGDAGEVLRAADVTVGWAKRDGKAQWALYDKERDQRDRERYALAASIPGALEEGRFRVDYLPVRSLADGAVTALEAKIVWEHPERGVLCPGAFLDQSSANGMVVRLVRWALEDACRQAGEWYAALGPRMPALTIDLPPRLCQEPELVAEVARVLERTGLPASLLRFELHEHLPALLTDEQLEELTILAERGVGLVLDQVNGGNVGVDRLRLLPLSGVKFTGAVVHGLDADANPVDESASVALLTWASALRVPLYAEDVRTEAEAARLAELGVTGAQGPHFGPPLAAAEVSSLLLT